jgi:TfoX/Sxy family transcriptional regulator of competence genes
MAYDEQLAERVRDLVAPRDGVTEKKMFGGIGWMLNGNMAVGVMSKGGLLVRIDPDETDAVLREPGVSTFGREGAKPMKGMVIVDADTIEDDATLADWVDRGAARASAMPPK